MKINHFFTCVLACALVALIASTMPAEERKTQELNQQLRERRIAYRDALQKSFDALQQRKFQGTDCNSCIAKVRDALLDATLAVESESDQRVKILKEYVVQLKNDEEFYLSRFNVGVCRMDEYCRALAHRIQGEVILLEEQERQKAR